MKHTLESNEAIKISLDGKRCIAFIEKLLRYCYYEIMFFTKMCLIIAKGCIVDFEVGLRAPCIPLDADPIHRTV